MKCYFCKGTGKQNFKKRVFSWTSGFYYYELIDCAFCNGSGDKQ